MAGDLCWALGLEAVSLPPPRLARSCQGSFNPLRPCLGLFSAAVGHRWLSSRRKPLREPSRTRQHGTGRAVVDREREPDLAKQVENLTGQLSRLKQDLEVCNAERDGAIRDRQSIEISWRDLSSTITNLKDESEAVQNCARELDLVLEEKERMLQEKDELTAVLQAEVKRLSAEHLVSKKEMELMEAEKQQEIEARIAAERVAKEAVAAKEKPAAKWQEEVDKLTKEKQILESEVSSLKESEDRLAEIQVTHLQAENESLKFRNHNLEDALQSWQNLDEDLGHIADKTEAKSAEILALDREKANLEDALRSMRDSLAQKEEAEARAAQSLEEILAEKEEAEGRSAELEQAARAAEEIALLREEMRLPVQFAELEALEATAEIASNFQAEIDRLKLKNHDLQEALECQQEANEDLVKAQAQRDRAAVAQLAADRRDTKEALDAKEEMLTKSQLEIDRLRNEHKNLLDDIKFLQASKEKLFEVSRERDLEFKEAQEAAMELLAAKEEVSSKLQLTADRLRSEVNSLQDGFEDLQSSKDRLEELQVDKDFAVEVAQRAAKEAIAAKEEVAASSQRKIDRLKHKKNDLEELVARLKSSNEALEASHGKKSEEAKAAILAAQGAHEVKEKLAANSQKEIDKLQNKIGSLRNVVDSLKASNGHLEKIQSKLDDALAIKLDEAQTTAEVKISQARAEAAAVREEMAASAEKGQQEVRRLKGENESLEQAVYSWKASKASLEMKHAEQLRAMEAQRAEAQQTLQAALDAKDEMAAKTQPEIIRLNQENASLEKAVQSWKRSKDRLEQTQAEKAKAAAEKLADADRAAHEAIAAKDKIAARMQLQIERLQAENFALADSVEAWKASMDKLRAESACLVTKLEAVLPERSLSKV